MKRCVFLNLLIVSLLMTACSPQKRLARDFAKISENTVIALYVPDSLVKINMRNDKDSINSDSCARVVNSLNDNVFLDVFIASFESAVNDYGIRVVYWEDSTQKPDLNHWIVDIPKIEMTEYCDYHSAVYFRQDSGYYYKQMPVNELNVAFWFWLSNGLTDEVVFNEQNYVDKINRKYDYDYNEVITYSIDTVSVKGAYGFAEFLGKLYAGYCFDYFMNDYIFENFPAEKDKKSLTELFKYYRYRYDPYESYFFITENDRLVPIK